jgi:transcription elongation factor
LKGERRLRVFENGVLRRIFDPKRDEVTGEWRKLRNEKLNDYSGVIKSRRKGWAGHVARMGENTVYWWGKMPLGRHRR